MRFGLDDSVVEKLTEVFEANPKVDKAYIFGSRAKGNFRADSDIDIAIKGYDLTLDDILKMSVAFEDKGITNNIDLLDYNEIKEPALIEHIDRVRVEFYSRWKEYKLSEVGSVITGNTPSSKFPEEFGNFTPFVTPSDYKNYNKWATSAERSLSNEGVLKLKNRLLPAKSLLVTCIGSDMGKVALNRVPVITNQQINSIKPLKSFDPEFLYYKLIESYDLLRTYGEAGTAVPIVNKSDFENIKIKVPDKRTQNSIATILGSFDDKIDLLHRQNKTLEQLAETLFRQWFVEEPEEDSIGKLGQYVKTTSGGTPSRSKVEYYLNGSIKWVKSKELDGSFIFDTEEKITEEALKNSSAKLLPQNSILVAMYGATVGEYALLAESASCNQAICALLPNNNYPYTFLFNFIKYNKENLIGKAVGSAQQNISQELIKDFEIIKPNKKILAYHLKTESMYQKIKSNISQIQSLTKMRDTLLPQLMSGEVRVKI